MHDPGSRPCLRLIPARAGNTASCISRKSRSAAHPRSRGEHGLPAKRRCTNVGSSPLARGTLYDGSRCGVQVRLIPARAGNTTHFLPLRVKVAAHPRSRGEHIPRLGIVRNYYGSSPLARGTPSCGANTAARTRLIPARAGNTSRFCGAMRGS